MQFLKLILRNALRHKLRTGLTVLGLVVAILAFGLLQTVVDAWYAGAESAAPNRLVTRNAISLTFPMPLHYRDKIRGVRRRARGRRRELVRRHLPGPEELLPAVRDRPGAVLRDVPGVPAQGGRAARVPARPQGRGDRAQARRDLRVQDRRHDPAAGHDLPGHLVVHGARRSTTARRRRPTPRRCSSTGTT